MTQWVGQPQTGRRRGPVALLRAWFDVVLRPVGFYRRVVVPGDQAPGLVFGATVVLVEEALRIVLVPDTYPVFGGRPLVSGILWLAVTAFFIAPAALHLLAALETGLLVGGTRLANIAPNRAGVSETVQVIGYATAPAVLAGVPSPVLQVGCTAYGAVLLFLGLSIVHDLSWARAVLVGILPAALLFGYGFRGIEALRILLGG